MIRTLIIPAFAVALSAYGQVKTEVPPVVPGPNPRPSSTSKFTALRWKAIWKAMPSIATSLCSCRPATPARRTRRYPVVYALHGYSIGAEQWSQEIHVPQTIEGAFAQGAQEMIVVLPDSKTVHNGSMYSSSVTTGDFEQFIARDVVAYIDAHYRTIPKRSSRGLVGHSMGGYGASRIGMKHAGRVRQRVHHEPVLHGSRGGRTGRTRKSKRRWKAVKTPADSAKLPFGLRAQLASAAAWSPNPKNPPLYLDLPTKDGVVAAGRHREMGRERAAGLRRSIHRQPEAVPGDRDRCRRPGRPPGRRRQTARDPRQLRHREHVRGLSGTHTSAVAVRFQNYVLPFFSKNLCAGKGCP